MVATLASLARLLLLDLSVPIVARTALQGNTSLLAYAILALAPPTHPPPVKLPAPLALVEHGPTLTTLAAPPT